MEAPAPRKPILELRQPPYEQYFYIHYCDDQSIGLIIDGKSYAVTP
jgi:hypothetical protein